ncbi:MAG: 50S ribosomal protein L17 [Planctomycetes bacterium]|nr:50S ribosomal protein L17 [Planctomycetota bacterium]
MRHLKKGRKLGRTKSHRLATLKALAMALIEHEAITTTIPKAREASRYVDRLITTARGGNLAARRLVASRLGNEAMAKKLFEDVAPRYATRPGGYTRVIKLAKFRIGDASQLARLELVEKREKPKSEKKEKDKKK